MRRRIVGAWAAALCWVACSGETTSTAQAGCPSGLADCGGKCVDVALDPQSCGACGVTCGEGELCSVGQCGTECLAGTSQCGDRCVDTLLDPQHCGGCNQACGSGEVCSAGSCGVSCLGGTTKCAGKCVDTNVDNAHCGACDAACPADQVCSAGSCGVECLGGSTKCGSTCVDVDIDPAHCGGCNQACGVGEVCSLGACAVECLGGTTKCAGKCVDTNVDPDSCGSCGLSCGFDEVCSSGTCGLECVGGSSKCGSECVDTSNDPDNCGACANKCPPGQVCSNDQCGLECLGGSTQCGGKCVDTQLDPAHCGGCGQACAQGEVCSAGACAVQCSGGTKQCGSVCVNIGSDPKHCGACNNPCLANEVCVGGSCVGTSCVPNASELCYSGPVNTIGVGPCKVGTKTCNAQGTGYGACAGETIPKQSETCGNLVDDDCNGAIDDGCSYTSCKALKAADPNAQSGVYAIDPDGNGNLAAVNTYCDLNSDGGGWTLLAKTVKAGLTATEKGILRESFWVDHTQTGYGSAAPASRLYWMPLSHWHALTTANPVNVFWQKSDSTWVRVRDFSVGTAAQKYKWDWSTVEPGYLSIEPGLKGASFTARDNDNDTWGANCSTDNIGYNGGFWYTNCYQLSMLHSNGNIYRLDQNVVTSIAYTELYLR